MHYLCVITTPHLTCQVHAGVCGKDLKGRQGNIMKSTAGATATFLAAALSAPLLTGAEWRLMAESCVGLLEQMNQS